MGLDSTRVWVREVARNMANSTGYIVWGIGVSQGLAVVRGGEGSPASGVLASSASYGSSQLAQSDQGAN